MTIAIYSSLLTEHLIRRGRVLQRAAGSIPPSGLVLLSSFVIQVATVLAKSLFETLGVIGAALICKGFAALFLLILYRPRLRQPSLQHYLLAIGLGVAMAANTLAIYQAIARIPLGIASTLEFIGPLGVALLGSRKPLDLLWVVLAALGIGLLNPIGNANLDPLGIAWALGSGGCWASYILLSSAVGRLFPGKEGLSISMTITALVMMPAGLAEAGTALLSWRVIGLGALIGILGTVLPYTMEYVALKRMPPRIFGVLMSVEPAIAALVGLLFMQEALGLQTWVAIVLVVSAAGGVTWFGGRSPNDD